MGGTLGKVLGPAPGACPRQNVMRICRYRALALNAAMGPEYLQLPGPTPDYRLLLGLCSGRCPVPGYAFPLCCANCDWLTRQPRCHLPREVFPEAFSVPHLHLGPAQGCPHRLPYSAALLRGRTRTAFTSVSLGPGT